MDFLKKIFKKAKKDTTCFNLAKEKQKKLSYIDNATGEWIEDDDNNAWDMSSDTITIDDPRHPAYQAPSASPQPQSPQGEVSEQDVDSMIENIGGSANQGLYDAAKVKSVYGNPEMVFIMMFSTLTDAGKNQFTDSLGQDFDFNRLRDSILMSAADSLSEDGVANFYMRNPAAMKNLLNNNPDQKAIIEQELRETGHLGVGGLDQGINEIASLNANTDTYRSIRSFLKDSLLQYMNMEISKAIVDFDPTILGWVYKGALKGQKGFKEISSPGTVSLNQMTTNKEDGREFGIDPTSDIRQQIADSLSPEAKEKAEIRKNMARTSLSEAYKNVGTIALFQLEDMKKGLSEVRSTVLSDVYSEIEADLEQTGQSIRERGAPFGEDVHNDMYRGLLTRSLSAERTSLYLNSVISQLNNLLVNSDDYHFIEGSSQGEVEAKENKGQITYTNRYGSINIPMEYSQAVLQKLGIDPFSTAKATDEQIQEVVNNLKTDEKNRKINDLLVSSISKSVINYKTTMYIYEDMLVSKAYLKSLFANPQIIDMNIGRNRNITEPEVIKVINHITSLPENDKNNNFIKERIYACSNITKNDTPEEVAAKLKKYIELNYMQLFYGDKLQAPGRYSNKESLNESLEWYQKWKGKRSEEYSKIGQQVEELQAKINSTKDPLEKEKLYGDIKKLRGKASAKLNDELFKEFKNDKDTLQTQAFKSICLSLEKFKNNPENAEFSSIMDVLLKFLTGTREYGFRNFSGSTPTTKLPLDEIKAVDRFSGKPRNRYYTEVFYSIAGEQIPSDVQEKIDFVSALENLKNPKLKKEYVEYTNEQAAQNSNKDSSLLKLRKEVEDQINSEYARLNKLIIDLPTVKNSLNMFYQEHPDKYEDLLNRYKKMLQNPDIKEDPQTFYAPLLAQTKQFAASWTKLYKLIKPLTEEDMNEKTGKPKISLPYLLGPKTKIPNIHLIDYYLKEGGGVVQDSGKKNEILQEMKSLGLLDKFDLKKLKLAYRLYRNMIKKYSQMETMYKSMNKFASAEESASRIKLEMEKMVEEFNRKLGWIFGN